VVRAGFKHYHAMLPAGTEGRDHNLATPEIKRLFQGARRNAQEAGCKTNKAKPGLVSDFEVLAGQMDSSNFRIALAPT
jgi:hypothetical protein